MADPDEFAAAPEALGDGSRPRRPEAAHWKTESKVELAIATERAAREADGRVAAVETTVFVDERAAVALASSRGASGAYEATYCYAFLSAIAEDGDDRQTGLGFGMGRSPAALDPEGSGSRRSVDRAARRGEAASRTCPVVLDETVAASFAGLPSAASCVPTRSSAGARRSPGGSGRQSARRPRCRPTTVPTAPTRAVRRRGHTQRGARR